MAGTSPTQRTLKYYRDLGWEIEVVEKYNAFARVRIDLFGCIDLIACKEGEGIVGIQATTDSHISARVNKSIREPRLHNWLRSGGRFLVVGWKKCGPRGKRKVWAPRIVTITLKDLQEEL